jgi:glycosyltransferase involved in cell wall biosynthesis
MRITFVNQYYSPDISATAQLVTSLAEYLADAGHNVTIVTSSARYASVVRENPAARETSSPRVIRVAACGAHATGIFIRMRQYAAFYLRAGWCLARLPRQDVIVSLTTPPFVGWLSVLHAWLKGRTKIILWNMESYPDILEVTSLIRSGGCVAWALACVHRGLLRHVDHVVCLDHAMKELLQRKYAPATLPMSVIPNWEPIATFMAPPGTWPKRAELGLEHRFVILYLGTAGFGHEIETVLRAAERLRDTPVSFLFVGGGSKHAEIRQWVTEQGLENVIQQGHVWETRLAVLNSANLALVTLSDEALGMMCPSKLHAYLAMSLPVIYVGPAGSNVDEAIEKYACGVSIRCGDVDQLTTFCRAAVSDPSMLADLRRCAREAFESEFCDVRVLPRFVALLDHVANDVRCSTSETTQESHTVRGD